MDKRLNQILTVKRGHNSEGEKRMVAEQLAPYEPLIYHSDKGEVLAYVVVTDAASKTLFSSHVDTVSKSGFGEHESQHNVVTYDSETMLVRPIGDVLGADDGAGVWLLLEMIDASVPGTYVFHRGEECGGIGSSGMARHHEEFLKKFDRAIAFDRQATHSVITWQSGGRCCSDEFAAELADRLTCDTYFLAPDDGGTFTDTANYTDYIGECTNVSIGYYNEHSEKEYLDLAYLYSLRDKCIELAWESLPSKRKPGEVDNSWSRFAPYGVSRSWWDSEFDYYKNKPEETVANQASDDLSEMSWSELFAWIDEDPVAATDILYDLLHQEEDYLNVGMY